MWEHLDFFRKKIWEQWNAGAIICNNKTLFDKISRYRNHGSLKKHDHLTFGINSRLDTFQASI